MLEPVGNFLPSTFSSQFLPSSVISFTETPNRRFERDHSCLLLSLEIVRLVLSESMENDEPAPPADLAALNEDEDQLPEQPVSAVNPVAQQALLDACTAGNIEAAEAALSGGALVRSKKF